MKTSDKLANINYKISIGAFVQDKLLTKKDLKKLDYSLCLIIKELRDLEVKNSKIKEAILEFEREYYKLINQYHIVFDDQEEKIINLHKKIFGDFEK